MTVLSVHSFRQSVSETAGKDIPVTKSKQTIPVVGGVDTHKDLHVAAVVDDNDQVLGTQSFATTRQGYKLMLTWMRSFGDLQRIGVECTGSYGAGLLRYMQTAGVDVLEVTAPDKLDRRRRGKNDDFDAQSESPRVYWRVKLSKDEPHGTEKITPEVHG
jgi:hypothetical protein